MVANQRCPYPPNRRLGERHVKQRSSIDHAREAQLLAKERARQLEQQRAALEARERRIALSRESLVDHGKTLEVLRARAGVLDEVLRARSFQLGSASERLRERRQQFRELARRRLEVRVQLGTAQWLAMHLCSEALNRWRSQLVAGPPRAAAGCCPTMAPHDTAPGAGDF